MMNNKAEYNRESLNLKDGEFLIKIKSTPQGDWQGDISWQKEQDEVPFQGMLQLIKLMDTALVN